MKTHLLAALISAALPLPPSAAAAEPGALVIFAAASLKDAFTEIAQLFSKRHPGLAITSNFGGSNELRTQLEHGAPADLFASASQKEMEKAAAAGLIEGPPLVFAHNRLVVLLPASNPGNVARLEDLARPGLKLDLAHPNVPAGGYSLQALGKMTASGEFGAGFAERVLANVVSHETNVKQVVAKVQLGEVDAGIVYRSDVTPRRFARFGTLEIPDRLNVVASYPVAVVKRARSTGLAREFIGFLLSEEGRAVLARHHFDVPRR